MTYSVADRRLLRVAKSDRQTLEYFEEGVSLERDLGRPVSKLREQAAADRLKLAERFAESAKRMQRSRSSDPRVVIGRLYYSMYHAMRSVVYFSHGGDDHQAHSTLYRNIPHDFPNAAIASNNLKDARIRRNEADYDPYPLADAHFKTVTLDLLPIATDFVSQCRVYLQGKGCDYL